MNSQPTWACSSPRSAPRQPPSCPAWGECGSPSWSEKAWCLRWSATQEITGPSIAAEPRIANVVRTHVLVWKLRWVVRRGRPAGEQPVQADGHAQPGEDVNDPEHDQVARVQPALPGLPAHDAQAYEGGARD